MRGEILGVERRRRGSDEDKIAIVGSVGVDGATVTQVAQRHDVTRQQIYAWRHDLKKKGLWSSKSGAVFLAIDLPTVENDPEEPAPASSVPVELLIIDELGFVPLSKTGAELLFELISQRYERGSTLITSNLPFEEWTETFGTERLTGALLDRLTHHVNILEMNGESYRLNQSRTRLANHSN